MVMVQEEILWLYKSKKDWLLHGDKNTNLFHKKTITWKRQNIIEAIQDNSGNLLYNEEEICSYAIGYFSSLFKSEAKIYQVYHVPNYFPILDATNLNCAVDPILEKEIKRVVFSMKCLKAPSIDGLHAIFYQSQWQIVWPSFCKFIADIFNIGKILQEVNTTLLVLIPKAEHPASLKMFRRISLCTVAYKTVTKIISNRLQALLPDFINSQQTSFVLCQHIVDNIIIVSGSGSLHA